MPKILGVFFFLASVQVCHAREIHVTTDFHYRERSPLSCAHPGLSCARLEHCRHMPQPCHSRLYRVLIQVARACLSYALGFFVGNRASLSCTAKRLCHDTTRRCIVVHTQPYRVRQGFRSWPTLSQPKNPLSQQKFSLHWPTLSRHKLALS